MKIGLHLPQIGPLANRESITAFAQLAEEHGFDSLWVSDHVIVPRRTRAPYPYSPDGRFPVPPDVPFLEPLATLLFVASVTQRVKLGTTILVIPMRNPIVTAKQLASLDVLSNGRLILGVGAGWMEEEFEMLGVPFERRGARTDEYIQLFKALWTEERPSFKGTFWRIDEVGFSPKPFQRPHPPIWVGGHGSRALRRAARLGDAWHAAYIGADEAQRLYQQVQRYAHEAGRDPTSVGFTVRTRIPLDDPDEAVRQLRAYRQAGVSHIALELFTPTLDQSRSLMALLAREIRPQVTG